MLEIDFTYLNMNYIFSFGGNVKPEFFDRSPIAFEFIGVLSVRFRTELVE